MTTKETVFINVSLSLENILVSEVILIWYSCTHILKYTAENFKKKNLGLRKYNKL